MPDSGSLRSRMDSAQQAPRPPARGRQPRCRSRRARSASRRLAAAVVDPHGYVDASLRNSSAPWWSPVSRWRRDSSGARHHCRFPDVGEWPARAHARGPSVPRAAHGHFRDYSGSWHPSVSPAARRKKLHYAARSPSVVAEIRINAGDIVECDGTLRRSCIPRTSLSDS